MESLIPVWALVPFVLMLLSIAVAPLVAEKWWESNLHKLYLSLILGTPIAIWMIACNTPENQFTHHLIHQMVYDYVPFILLLMSLFVVTGGIRVNGDIPAHPIITTSFIAIGWLLASFMGTTGAAMLLIRPLIMTISQRKHIVHTIIFFIFAVANCGGLLTPLGDPPLFLLFQKGAPFGWFMQLSPIWAFVGILLLIIYYLTDLYWYKKEHIGDIRRDLRHVSPLVFKGLINIVWLVAIIASVMFINGNYIPAMNDAHAPWYIKLMREFVLIGIIILSMITTKKSVRVANQFSWEPIMEVAVLFIGIFSTMTPALMFLKQQDLGLTEPWQFFYCTGVLSSFLDNAPTALVFHALAGNVTMEGASIVAGIPEILLKTISCGAVFFGAMTYIGNGPNFMVKAIAERSGIKMPSFFGYMGYSLLILAPIYVLVHIVFFL